MPIWTSLDSVVDVAKFHRVSSDFRSLSDRLPPDAVESLAREVVTRLARRRPPKSAVSSPSEAEIERLTEALVSPDPEAGAQAVVVLRDAGVPIADVYLHYLAASAATMGRWWQQDRLSFVEVTIGTSRILAILRSLKVGRPFAAPEDRPSAIFAAIPGEQHIIGVTMAADLFRRAGWRIELRVGDSHEALIGFVAGSPIGLIGLSAHGREELPALVRLIAAIRAAARPVRILVCGRIVDDARDLIPLTGADGYSRDVDSAMRDLDLLRLAEDSRSVQG